MTELEIELMIERAADKAVEKSRDLIRTEVASHLLSCPIKTELEISKWKAIAVVSMISAGSGGLASTAVNWFFRH